jgi:hypothetical protein
MIDAARALPLLRAAAADWTWNPDTQVPGWLKSAVTGFSRWETLVADQFDVLSTALRRIRELLPAGVSGPETAQEVRRSLKDSEKVGLAPSQDDTLKIQALLAIVDQANWRVIPELENDLNRGHSAEDSPSAKWNATLTAVARDRGESLFSIREFLDASDQLLDEALAKAEARSDAAGDGAVQQVQRLLQEWGGLRDEEGWDR